MSKAFLLKTEADAVFRDKKLEFREPGFSKDLEKLYVGGLTENIHIPNESFVDKMIKSKLSTHGPKFGTSAALEEGHIDGTFAFNTDTSKLLLKINGNPIAIPTRGELAASEQATVTVTSENIDDTDGHVRLENFNRPVKMIFVDSLLCIKGANGEKRYEFDPATKLLKVYGCSDGSIISYF